MSYCRTDTGDVYCFRDGDEWHTWVLNGPKYVSHSLKEFQTLLLGLRDSGLVEPEFALNRIDRELEDVA